MPARKFAARHEGADTARMTIRDQPDTEHKAHEEVEEDADECECGQSAEKKQHAECGRPERKPGNACEHSERQAYKKYHATDNDQHAHEGVPDERKGAASRIHERSADTTAFLKPCHHIERSEVKRDTHKNEPDERDEHEQNGYGDTQRA